MNSSARRKKATRVSEHLDKFSLVNFTVGASVQITGALCRVRADVPSACTGRVLFRSSSGRFSFNEAAVESSAITSCPLQGGDAFFKGRAALFATRETQTR